MNKSIQLFTGTANTDGASEPISGDSGASFVISVSASTPEADLARLVPIVQFQNEGGTYEDILTCSPISYAPRDPLGVEVPFTPATRTYAVGMNLSGIGQTDERLVMQVRGHDDPEGFAHESHEGGTFRLAWRITGGSFAFTVNGAGA